MVNALRVKRPSRCAVVLAALVMTGCGGSSEEGDGYPVMFEQYGETGSCPVCNPANFAQAYSWSNGDTLKYTCTGNIRVLNQEGATWSGRVSRGNPSSRCYSSAEIAGERKVDGSIHFVLTQERWRDCTALGPSEYTGRIEKNRFYAIGVTELRCDDGLEGTVTETMWGDHQAPEGSHDV